ncbi:hydrogenase expression/formation protein HupK [Pseudooceanicola marinus]|uniref:hydrogenase expression/formation protein HupK n=1 Tax=Pseudooceanicola marinus TaxID=396013 RepID=UPI001CD2D0D2|nr:hydrogenase expression/formation protein HupK [Pseudooceanicola marinus]MCA1334142.1 hydrogenase expression/formation protein HupK [Pseudooceanicola marinus]
MNAMVAAPSGLRLRRPPALPVARLVIGKRVEEVEALLPRIFALCRNAQTAAVQGALGRLDAATVQPALRGIAEEMLRDNLLKFLQSWPRLLGLTPRDLDLLHAPPDWIALSLFGSAGRLPTRPADMAAFLGSGQGIAPVLAGIDAAFGPGEGVAEGLPLASAANAWDGAIDNGPAARHATHPAMAALEALGRGPLWRALGRAYDTESALRCALPAIHCPAPGTAIVPATRGAYAIRIAQKEGIVTEFERITPTCSLLAPGGVADRALASLPGGAEDRAPLLLDILDPCTPVQLEATHGSPVPPPAPVCDAAPAEEAPDA